MKIVVFRYEEEIVTTLSIGYDESTAEEASLCGGSVTKIQKNSLPAVPKERP